MRDGRLGGYTTQAVQAGGVTGAGQGAHTHTFRACPAPPHARTARPLQGRSERTRGVGQARDGTAARATDGAALAWSRCRAGAHGKGQRWLLRSSEGDDAAGAFRLELEGSERLGEPLCAAVPLAVLVSS